MTLSKNGTDSKLEAWVTARKRHKLSHAHVQMARELGMNPAKLGKIDNHRQERWKAPLPEFIETLYEKRFGRRRPDNVVSIEALASDRARKKELRRQRKAKRRSTVRVVDPDAVGVGTLEPRRLTDREQ